MLSLVVSFILSVVIVGLAWFLVSQARRFSAIEDEWRQRERVLIDRLLQRNGVVPLAVERENVLRLADLEQQTAETIEQVALREDMILEELEQVAPGARGLTPADARELFPEHWQRLRVRFDEERTPLRVG